MNRRNDGLSVSAQRLRTAPGAAAEGQGSRGGRKVRRTWQGFPAGASTTRQQRLHRFLLAAKAKVSFPTGQGGDSSLLFRPDPGDTSGREGRAGVTGGFPMTEMVYGSNPVRVSEPVLPRWWRTIDKWTLTSVFVLFGIGLLLGLAASVPLAHAQRAGALLLCAAAGLLRRGRAGRDDRDVDDVAGDGAAAGGPGLCACRWWR